MEEQSKYIPMKMHPCYKEYLWGGSRLKTKYNKSDAPEVCAESWELAAHPDGSSTVYAPQRLTLDDLGNTDKKGFWGKQCDYDRFPLLVKFIDAQKNLSIQVHPSDETALSEKNEHGKAEMWYIVDCNPQAFIYLGFSKKISKQEFLDRIKNGSICDVLNKVPVVKGDVYYIEPGTVHAIGAGIVIAEIQQNSNTTFRVYDYERRDSYGNLRQLHIERAADAVDLNPVIPENCRANSSMYFPEFSFVKMFSCRYFHAYRIDVYSGIRLSCDGDSFKHLLCVEGNAVIKAGKNEYEMKLGDSYFMPAGLGKFEITGRCRMLMSQV